MQGSSGPARSPLVSEPSAALRSLVDLPLKTTLSAASVESLRGLGEETRKAKAREDWSAVYASGVTILEGIVAEVDANLEELQRKILHSDDPNDAKNRIAGVPRREAERGRNDARAALQRVGKEWVERSRRQLERVTTQCLESAQSIAIKEKETHDGVELSTDPAWWSQYVGFVGRCADEWTSSFTSGAEESFASQTAAAISPALAHASGQSVAAPPSLAPPENEARLPLETPSKELEIQGTAAALLQSVRSNVMAVGIFGTVLVVVVTLVDKIPGLTAGVGAAHGTGPETHSAPNSMMMRGILILAVLPFSIIFGLKSIAKQRAAVRAKGIAAHRTALQSFLKLELERALERHRKVLERWLSQRAELWSTAIDRWWETHVETKLAEYEQQSVTTIRELKLQQGRMSEELSALKTLRNQLSQTLLFELRRRLRELQETA
jgi:hypothetical protein